MNESMNFGNLGFSTVTEEKVDDTPAFANNANETEQKTMAVLKDFQCRTVERIDYLFRNGQNRVLVADEVGLGKTLIARGVIAKTAKLRIVPYKGTERLTDFRVQIIMIRVQCASPFP